MRRIADHLGFGVTEAEQQFSALQGVEAQTLSATEMDGIHGAVLTTAEAAYIARLDAAVTNLVGKIRNEKLATAVANAWTVTKAKLTAFLTATP